MDLKDLETWLGDPAPAGATILEQDGLWAEIRRQVRSSKIPLGGRLSVLLELGGLLLAKVAKRWRS